MTVMFVTVVMMVVVMMKTMVMMVMVMFMMMTMFRTMVVFRRMVVFVMMFPFLTASTAAAVFLCLFHILTFAFFISAAKVLRMCCNPVAKTFGCERKYSFLSAKNIAAMKVPQEKNL